LLPDIEDPTVVRPNPLLLAAARRRRVVEVAVSEPVAAPPSALRVVGRLLGVLVLFGAMTLWFWSGGGF
jgi:hypothetical protein